jgi:hypothetical protein
MSWLSFPGERLPTFNFRLAKQGNELRPTECRVTVDPTSTNSLVSTETCGFAEPQNSLWMQENPIERLVDALGNPRIQDGGRRFPMIFA